MNDETAREKLAAALASVKWPDGDPMIQLARVHRQTVADALLPVVREIAAEELRAVMEDRTTVAKLSPVERLTCLIVKVEDLLPRIAALAPTKAAS